MDKFYSSDAIYPLEQICNPELDKICWEFFLNFEREAKFFTKEFYMFKEQVPSEHLGVYESFLSTIYVLPIVNFIDHLKNCLYKSDQEIEALLAENFSSFNYDGFPTGPILESIEFLFSYNTKFSITEFLLKFNKFFVFLNKNPELRYDIFNTCLLYFRAVIKPETLSSKFSGAIFSVNDFESFYKNKIFNFYFDCLNTLLLNGYPELEGLNIEYFPKDNEIYISLLEFIFDLDKDIDMGIAEFLYKIVSFYEVNHGFKLDSDIINRLVCSSKTIDFMMLIEILRHQDSQDDIEFSSISFRSTFESIKYKNPYLYVLASKLILASDKSYESFDDIIYLNRDLVLKHISENPYSIPFLIKEKSIKDIFLTSSYDFSEKVDFSIFDLGDLNNKDKFMKILAYHFTKKNIRPISFLIFLALDLETDRFLANFLDHILNYFNYSNSAVKKFTNFFNFIYQEYSQIGSSKFRVTTNSFLKVSHLYLDIDSFMRDYRVFHLKKSGYQMNAKDLRVIANDQSLTSQRIITVVRNLLVQNESEELVSNLFRANTFSSSGAFLDFKYPFGYPDDFLGFSGPQIESEGVSLSVGVDLDSLLNIGKSPVETCLAYDQPLTSKFLAALIVEPSVTCWYFHRNDQLIARRLMILAEKDMDTIFLAMPIYSLEKDQEFLMVADVLTRYMCNENGFDLIIYDQGDSHPAGTKIERKSESKDYEITIDFLRSGCFKFDFLKKDTVVDYNEVTSSYRLTSSIKGYLFESED